MPAELRLPTAAVSPARAITVRLVAAVGLLLAIVALVYVDRDGYRDVNEDGVSLLDAFYYATVSLSTTGYGDITPTSDSARLINVLLITPARVAFLIILVGTTLEVLTERSRQDFRRARWRRTVQDHVIVCGYGTKGRSAVRTLLAEDTPTSQILVVENDPQAARAATAAGLAVVEGTSTRSSVLAEARVDRARAVIVATDTDDAAVLTVLTAREVAGQPADGPNGRRPWIVAAVREAENAPLLRQSGANQVVVSSETSGQLLGLSIRAPELVDVVADLLTNHSGLALSARVPQPSEIGRDPRGCTEPVVAVLRDRTTYRYDDVAVAELRATDRLVVIRSLPAAG